MNTTEEIWFELHFLLKNNKERKKSSQLATEVTLQSIESFFVLLVPHYEVTLNAFNTNERVTKIHSLVQL